jgi:hypothetical protein
MDLGFLQRRHGFAGRSDARLDYGVLVATLEAIQSASAGAHAEVGAAALGRTHCTAQDPLVELILGGPGWREAIALQGGCFNADYAVTQGNRL